MRSVRGHIDSRRRLLPRDYLLDPWQFGQPIAGVNTCLPAGGDRVSKRVAEVQHHLVVTWRANGRYPQASVLCEQFGMSKQTWSRVTLGERWAGETVLAALTAAVLSNPKPR